MHGHMNIKFVSHLVAVFLIKLFFYTADGLKMLSPPQLAALNSRHLNATKCPVTHCVVFRDSSVGIATRSRLRMSILLLETCRGI
jgi:hypothetical protein